jgi:hypothetical protein
MSNIMFGALMGTLLGGFTLFTRSGRSLAGFKDIRNWYPIASLAALGGSIAWLLDFLKPVSAHL